MLIFQGVDDEILNILFNQQGSETIPFWFRSLFDVRNQLHWWRHLENA